MNFAEAVVTIANGSTAAYCYANGNRKAAIFGGAVAASLVLADAFCNYIDRKQQLERERRQDEFNFQLMKLEYE